MSDGTGGSTKLIEVARFPSRLEAETIGHALDPHDIPFLVQSADVGIFGPGMVGATSGGAALLVPAGKVEDVRALLSCIVPVEDDQLGNAEEGEHED